MLDGDGATGCLGDGHTHLLLSTVILLGAAVFSCVRDIDKVTISPLAQNAFKFIESVKDPSVLINNYVWYYANTGWS